MRVLVTGGAGFIGSHVVEALTASGAAVRVIDALLPSAHPAGRVPDLPAGVHFVHGDVRDPVAVEAALADVDVVCHQAAMVGLGTNLDDAPMYAGCNDVGTAVLLAAMGRTGTARLVLASSMVVYGEGRYLCATHGEVVPRPRDPAALRRGSFEPPCPRCGADLAPGLVDESARTDPRNVYAATKLAQEHLSASWSRVTGGVAAVLRYHNVYGARMPRDTPYAGVASLFRSALERGEAPRVFEDGGQRRDFVHVRDVAAANAAAVEWTVGAPAASVRTFNVGSGVPHTIGEMADALAAAHGGPSPVVTGDFRLGDVRHVTACSRRAHTELGWQAAIPFEAGIAEFAALPLRR
ncbi:NAD-dependent epimerase/dehydratase family protein [Actinacidiphila paucisporea]|uniref:UDP-glucose 4-epimerase n=1 Tax=Actinacidiphila paucisporea TaxID=310782 RepID=A0A1M7H9N0_9ACTN|nr:NAD-dependent epimerase/dehydratase family protein [Actinacidiphila paucisporea]SHM25224.1 dTDP-L-rhamnose 4-epimerase [Actinacidiphila paucisporea]